MLVTELASVMVLKVNKTSLETCRLKYSTLRYIQPSTMRNSNQFSSRSEQKTTTA
jgi:hypothetical protein